MFFFFAWQQKSKMGVWDHKIPLNTLSLHTNTPNWMCIKVTADSWGKSHLCVRPLLAPFWYLIGSLHYLAEHYYKAHSCMNKGTMSLSFSMAKSLVTVCKQ